MDSYTEIIQKLISVPLRSQIKINFDLKKKLFKLSIPIFGGRSPLPQSLKTYVGARENRTFKPERTSFEIQGSQVILIQEIEFSSSLQPDLRHQVDAFWKMGKQCHRMLSEIALEEKCQDALFFYPDNQNP